MKIESPAFADGGHIPEPYSRSGANVNPPLLFRDVPAHARSLALVVDDPDAPKGTFTHWVIFNLEPAIDGLAKGYRASSAREGKNGWEEIGYGGPQPPDGEHRYFFKFYALDRKLDLPNGAERKQVGEAMNGHVVAQAELMGRFATPVQGGRGVQ